MNTNYLLLHGLLFLVWTSCGLAAAPPSSPRQQQKLFHLPSGFEIQLVVSEPEIGQPMNLNFDARGRLWITSSVEYPYPADSAGVQPRPDRFGGIGQHDPRDWVTIVEGFAKDGHGLNVTNFATGLNIPIGQTALGKGDEAIVYSIPNIDKFTDEDRDGIAEKRSKLYGPVGNIDTHGMVNSFTPWIDGWIYGCHGFSNTSEITDDQGTLTRLTSGNTYRFRADGSRFEAFTYGQVNPFGMTFDPLGNLYNADCHSMPVYQLLRGARYPHFGAKPDALGFGPTMINHNHGSTGICGPVYYSAEHFPKDYRDNLFICNPVSQVIHRDKLKQFGSTYQVETQPDFIRCDDTWFRPVDLKMGPDGALYIADFYNPIIGHYESPLDHPDRDRTHGRVWRVVYTGGDASSQPLTRMKDLTELNESELLRQLDSSNVLVRTLATNLLVDGYSSQVSQAVTLIQSEASPQRLAHSLWVVERTQGLNNGDLLKLAANPDPLVRVHLMKALAERGGWSRVEYEIVRKGLQDKNAFVVRAAIDALGRHPDAANVRPILAAWKQALPEDTHLEYVVRLALREHFRRNKVPAEESSHKWNEEEKLQLTAIANVAESDSAAQWLILHQDSEHIDWEVLRRVARQAATQHDSDMLKRIIELTRESPAWKQLSVLNQFSMAHQEAGSRPFEHVLARGWAERLWRELNQELGRPLPWTVYSLNGSVPIELNPWAPRDRRISSGDTKTFLDSIVHGEQQTGILRSRSFRLPKQIHFWLCGQDGLPNKQSLNKNLVRVVLVENNEVIARQYVPRNDVASQVSISLNEHSGKSGYIEVVDGNDAASYAWIAVWGFSPEVPPLPVGDTTCSKSDLLKLVRDFRIFSAKDQLTKLLDEPILDWDTRISIAETLEVLGTRGGMSDRLIAWLNDSLLPSEERQRVIRLLGREGTPHIHKALIDQLKNAAAQEQVEISMVLGETEEGVSSLLDAIEQGQASAYVLQNVNWKQRTESVVKSAGLKDRIAKLIEGFPSASEQEEAEIQKALVDYSLNDPSLEGGAKSFEKRCTACHQLNGHGNLVGPQLDGIGNRPLERIVEDILAPNRNVDAAFRTVLIQTIDGQIISGLPRREEGEVLVLADAEGKEVRIAKDDIELRKQSPLSLMPANLGKQIPKSEFMDLIRFLLSQQNHSDE